MIIGISGKIGSGKDTVGQIIIDLTSEEAGNHSGWQVKKYAMKLKQIVALLIGCKVNDLEIQEFKNQPLDSEWQKPFGISTDVPEPITPRKILQLIGTEGGRNLIHENIWVNALFADYKSRLTHSNSLRDPEFPNWIITDMRFPNELDAVKSRGGLTIRVNRGDGNTGDHPSETALDDAEFDYVINNNGTLEDLRRKVSSILYNEEVLSVD